MVRELNIPANCYTFGIDSLENGFGYYQRSYDSEEEYVYFDEDWDNRNFSHCFWWHKESGVVILFIDEPGIDWDFIDKFKNFTNRLQLNGKNISISLRDSTESEPS